MEGPLMSPARSANHERTFSLLKVLEAHGRRLSNDRVTWQAVHHLNIARDRWAVDVFRYAA
jgi:hypothetical protein